MFLARKELVGSCSSSLVARRLKVVVVVVGAVVVDPCNEYLLVSNVSAVVSQLSRSLLFTAVRRILLRMPIVAFVSPSLGGKNSATSRSLIACTETIAPLPTSLQASSFSTGPRTSQPKALSLPMESLVAGWVHMNVFIAGHRIHGFSKSHARMMLRMKLSVIPKAALDKTLAEAGATTA